MRSTLVGGEAMTVALAARFLELLEDLRLDLHVPGVVPVTGLQHGLRGRGGLAATLEVDGREVRLVGLAIVLVDDVDDLIVFLEGVDLVGRGADRVGQEGFGRGSRVVSAQNVLAE